MAGKIDILNRQEFVMQLVSIVQQLANEGNGCTFAIDGLWGSGKSYVLDMLESEINLFQHPDAAGGKYIVFRYDCWQYDYYDEPAIAIIAAIRDACEKYNQLIPKPTPELAAAFKVAKDLGKELVYNVMETKIGWSPESIINRYEEHRDGVAKGTEKSRKYDTFFEFKSILTKTRKQLSQMAADKPIIIIVDELDRCIPEYAIKVLERLHHFFESQSNIVVILAYDGQKLNHVVRNIYGIEADDVQHFMRKFIDFSVQLNIGIVSDAFWERHKSYLEYFDTMNDDDIKELSRFSSQLFKNIDVRTQEKIIDRIIVLHKLAFVDLSDLSILYYELLHQVINYKYSKEHISDWLPEIRSTKNAEQAYDLGIDLYEYIKEIEGACYRGNIFMQGDANGSFHQIIESPIALAFWYIATLKHKIINNTCCKYFLHNSSQYDEIVIAAKKFNELSKMIK